MAHDHDPEHEHEHEHEHDRAATYDEELAITRGLLARGDHAHALHHCVSALMLAPQRDEWRAPLRMLLADEDLVARLRGEPYVGAAAALALHQFEHGEHAAALEVLSHVIAAVPHLGFQAWFSRWLAASPGTIDPAPLHRVLMLATTFGVGRLRLLPGERAAAEELVPIAEVALRTQTEPVLVWLASATLRRAGRAREAIAAAERAYPSLPPAIGGSALGLALRAAGDVDRAVAVFDAVHAATRDPDFRHEKLRALADAGRWADAIAIADELARTTELGDENRAEHALLRAKLAARAARPDAPPLDVVRRRALGHGALLAMTDATANGLRDYGAQKIAATPDGTPASIGDAIRGSPITLAISGDEGASNRLCLALMLTGEANPRRATYSIDGSALTTVRPEPSGPALWRHDGDVVVQALPPPPPAVSGWVQQLALWDPTGTPAESSFAPAGDFLDLWHHSRRSPPLAGTPDEWLAAAVHPRMPLHRVAMGPDWVYRWQVCALIGLAHASLGWAGTPKRAALLGLLDGAIDWPLAAAIRVLAEIALEDPEATVDIRAHLLELAHAIGRPPNAAIVTSLQIALDAIPFVPEHVKASLREEDADDGA